MKGMIRLAIILFVVCALAAGSLALVNEVTREPIAEQARRETDVALRAVAPDATEFRATDDTTWDALDDGRSVGGVRAVKAKGYSGPIRLVVGTDTEGRITGVRVISQTETPGLGTKVATDTFLDQFRGKASSEVRLKKDDPAGTIDAVTAATISSRAVVQALRQALGGE